MYVTNPLKLRFRAAHASANVARLGLCVTAALGAFALLSLGVWSELQQYVIVVSLFTMLCGVFLVSSIREGKLPVMEIPVFLTLMVFVQFGLAPLEVFLNPNTLDFNFSGVHTYLVRALVLFIVAMVAYWAGVYLVRRSAGPQIPIRPTSMEIGLGNRVLLWGLGIYCIGFVAKVVMWNLDYFGYTRSNSLVFENLASSQALLFFSNLATCGLIILAIEVYSRPRDTYAKALFVVVFLLECGWGLLSGMKEALLLNFLILVIVSAFYKGKLPMKWVLLGAVLFILIYPFYSSYRTLVRGRDVSGIAAAIETGKYAAQFAGQQQGAGGVVVEGLLSTANRLDLLQSFGLILSFGSQTAVLEGDEKLWMIPYFPFVPRFLWKDKPVLLKGSRFSVLLGGTADNSMAMTYPADLYMLGKVPAILIGMFLFGAVGQGLVNYVNGTTEKKALFLYAGIFIYCTKYVEVDTFSLWTLFIRLAFIYSLLGLLVYGRAGWFRHVPARTAG